MGLMTDELPSPSNDLYVVAERRVADREQFAKRVSTDRPDLEEMLGKLIGDSVEDARTNMLHVQAIKMLLDRITVLENILESSGLAKR